MSFLPAQPVQSSIEANQRSQRHGHEPFTVLLTGLPASGKTTIAKYLEQSLFSRGAVGLLLDGESLRHGISKGLGFSKEERSENLRRGAEIAKLLNDSGQFCVAAFCAPEEAMRQKFCEIVGRHRVVHVHLDASVAACRRRDTTGRYLAAEQGRIDGFPGVSAEYEVPKFADLTISTDDRIDAEDAVSKLLALFKSCRRFATR
jgi:bifunctional enzyme CysN/CysC